MSSEGGDLINLKVVHSESTQKALREHLKSTQRAIRDQESNQTKSYSRSLKYFVLFQKSSYKGSKNCPLKNLTNLKCYNEDLEQRIRLLHIHPIPRF